MANNRHRRVGKLKKQENQIRMNKIKTFRQSIKIFWNGIIKWIKGLWDDIKTALINETVLIKKALDEIKVYKILAKEYGISIELVKFMLDYEGDDITLENGRSIINNHFGLD